MTTCKILTSFIFPSLFFFFLVWKDDHTSFPGKINKVCSEVRRKIYVVQFKTSCKSHPVSPKVTSLLLKREDGHLGVPVLLWSAAEDHQGWPHLQQRSFDLCPFRHVKQKKKSYTGWGMWNRQASYSLVEFVKFYLLSVDAQDMDIM